MFRVAALAGVEDPATPVIMFLDEIDAVGAARGESLLRVGDRVLQSLMAELEGLTSRGNVLVLAATNRQDALDPALLRPGRLGDHIIHVPRPSRSAGQDILGKYLPADIPYAAPREAIIDAALSVIFSPNGEGELATLVFRDGTRRTVRQADLVSGAVLANISRQAVERACLREVQTGRSGVNAHDVLDSITEQFEATARGLTPTNCRRYFAWLPQDLDVVSVQPVVRKVRQPHKYMTLNVA
jgi:SpoVK/Ycf46/Vps4 family AAA+-type ATPase